MGDKSGFGGFVGEVRPRLARAFVAAYGPARGEEALAEALAYAWEHYDELVLLDNPAGLPVPGRTEPQSTSSGRAAVPAFT